jgi:hypothetical protein
MSIHRSYFNKSNTLVYNSYTNTARNPIVELFFGRVENIQTPVGYSRYIFNVNITDLQQKISSGEISTNCGTGMTHTLRMTNTSAFDETTINDKTPNGRRRATSFDLVLLRIPQNQSWDSGVGYDYYDYNATIYDDKSFSERPSNWFQRTTINNWLTPGIYNNANSATGTGINYSALTEVHRQHFEFGNEDIEFNMTNEINGILAGTIQSSGYIIAFLPQVENITGMTENYSVGFFSPYTQTFYEPFLETNYYDQILDDRNSFHEGLNNNLYLYVYENGNPINLDSNPTVDILDIGGTPVDGFTGLTTCKVTKGVYKVSVNGLTSDSTPCLFYDLWKGLTINGQSIDDQENEFVLLEKKGKYSIGTTTNNPKIYGFDYDGIKQNEKILNTDVRKVNVNIKQAYSSKEVLNNVECYYRIYVKEGTTEVQVQDWTRINRTPDGHYFVFDTRDKIPNEYFVDIKVNSDKNVDTYKRDLQFEIVNKK